METYYIKIKRNSEIGSKLSKLLSVIPKAMEEAKVLCEKYNFKCYREGYWTYAGGLSSFSEPTKEVNEKLFKKNKYGDYEPRLNSKIGKSIQKEMQTVSRVERSDVNALFGLDIFSGLGISFNNKEWIGVAIKDKKAIPHYATEITRTEYETL